MRPISIMAASFSKLPTHAAAAIAVGLCGAVLSACSGPASSLSPAGTLPQTARALTSYSFQTVDDPNSNVNAVSAINQLGKIVGVYGGGGSGSGNPASYASQPDYVKFTGMTITNAQGTVATSMSSNKIVGGYVINPNSLGGIWGFVRIKGMWTLLKDANEGTGGNAVTEILGINDSALAVGFYTNPYGVNVPFELDVTTETFTDLAPGAANAEATGVNGKGNIVGWEATSSGVAGWFLEAGTYHLFSYPGAQVTYARSVNWSDQVVGDYVDGYGMTHGFILEGATKGQDQQIWQPIDEPNAAYGTWLTGISNHHDICGYYVDASGVQHGFVAAPSAS